MEQEEPLVLEQGDIVGFSPAGFAPADSVGMGYGIVVSDWSANVRTPYAYIVPIVLASNGSPYDVAVNPGNAVGGFARCDAMKAVDVTDCARKGAIGRIGAIDDETLMDILDIVLIILGQN